MLATAQELLFGRKVLFDWRLGDNWALVSMENLDRELEAERTGRRDDGTTDERRRDDDDERPKYVHRMRIVWFNAVGFLLLHVFAVYGFYLFLTSSMIYTVLWSKHRVFVIARIRLG